MSSTRFPGKPLAPIMGIPMVGHVYFRSKMSKMLDEVYIATCDEEVMDYATSIGAKCVMTSDAHERASDRTAEALLKIETKSRISVSIVVMIQGDEPMIIPEMIDDAVRPFYEDPGVIVCNLMAPLKSITEHEDPNEVKVVVDLDDFAIYFSREPIPSRKKSIEEVHAWKQVCIIPFRKEFLLKFNELRPTPLEETESVDMLRVIEHGMKVKMIRSNHDTYSVDTEAELESVERMMKDDPLVAEYK